MLENRVKIAYLALGSNLGNRYINIELAKVFLLKNNIKIIKSSSYYETLSWPNKLNPKFLNIVLKIKTSLDFVKLLDICKKIEILLGRKKSEKNSPRECDIDIIDYDKSVILNGVILPHPRMHTRNFVLIPLFEINNNWIHPKNKRKISKLISNLSMINISAIKLI